MSAFLSQIARNRWILPTLVVTGFAVSILSHYQPIFSGYTQIILITIGINIILCVT